MMHSKRAAQLGNTATEYGFIGAIVLLGGLAGLYWLSDGFSGTFQHLRQDMIGNVQAAHTAAGRQIDNSAELTSSLPAEYDEILRRLQQTSLTQSLQTAGANGTTRQLASELQALTEKLLRDGLLTEVQAALLQQLANQGYEIAEVQALIEQQVSAAGNNRTQFDDLTITYNGKTYSMQDAGLLIGWKDVRPKDLTNGSLSIDDEAGSVLQTFLNLYRDAMETTSDPTLRALLEQLSEQIVITADSVETFTCKNDSSDYGPDEYLNRLAEVAGSASVETVHNSDGICDLGNGNRQDMLENGTLPAECT